MNNSNGMLIGYYNEVFCVQKMYYRFIMHLKTTMLNIFLGYIFGYILNSAESISTKLYGSSKVWPI